MQYQAYGNVMIAKKNVSPRFEEPSVVGLNELKVFMKKILVCFFNVGEEQALF